MDSLAALHLAYSSRKRPTNENLGGWAAMDAATKGDVAPRVAGASGGGYEQRAFGILHPVMPGGWADILAGTGSEWPSELVSVKPETGPKPDASSTVPTLKNP
mmetsp:Transcript_66374/g.160519  ORF Transcript_66374/g.160519 Transcript_66374/m.160519 type:complete len:103 (+) Transcript_66374:797-1105(+)